MALTLVASGTQAAVISTEHSLLDSLNPGIFVMLVDLTNMALGDTVELRVKTKVLSTSALDVAYFQSFSGAQSSDNLVQVSVPFPSDQEAKFTLKQTAGTGRNYDWKIFTL